MPTFLFIAVFLFSVHPVPDSTRSPLLSLLPSTCLQTCALPQIPRCLSFPPPRALSLSLFHLHDSPFSLAPIVPPHYSPHSPFLSLSPAPTTRLLSFFLSVSSFVSRNHTHLRGNEVRRRTIARRLRAYPPISTSTQRATNERALAHCRNCDNVQRETPVRSHDEQWIIRYAMIVGRLISFAAAWNLASGSAIRCPWRGTRFSLASWGARGFDYRHEEINGCCVIMLGNEVYPLLPSPRASSRPSATPPRPPAPVHGPSSPPSADKADRWSRSSTLAKSTRFKWSFDDHEKSGRRSSGSLQIRSYPNDVRNNNDNDDIDNDKDARPREFSYPSVGHAPFVQRARSNTTARALFPCWLSPLPRRSFSSFLLSDFFPFASLNLAPDPSLLPAIAISPGDFC